MKQASLLKSGRHLLFGMLAGLVPLTVVHAQGTYNQDQSQDQRLQEYDRGQNDRGPYDRDQYDRERGMPSEPRGAQGPMRSETMSSEQFAERQRQTQRIQLRDEQSRKELSHLPFWKEYEQIAH